MESAPFTKVNRGSNLTGMVCGIPEATFAELGESAFADFDALIGETRPDMCQPFFAAADRLEASVLSIYRMKMICARNEEDLDAVAAQWKSMASICELALLKIARLQEAHPYCGADYFYDRMFELRAKCLRLHQMHA